MRKIKNIIISIYLLVSLLACESTTQSIATLSEENPAGAEDGVLVVRIVNSKDNGTIGIPFNFLTLSPKDNAKDMRVPSQPRIQGSSTLFVAPVPAGEYALTNIETNMSHSTYTGSGIELIHSYFDSTNTDTSLGTFTITPGVVTDLGTLIHYPSPPHTSSSPAVIRSPNKTDGSIVKTFSPSLDYQKDLLISWNNDKLEPAQQDQYRLAVDNPITYNQHHLANDGSVYFFGKLGTLIKRSKNGIWSTEKLNTDFDLVTMAQTANGDLLVGGELGNLFLKQANQQWRKIIVPSRYRIEKIIPRANFEIDLIVISEDRIEVIRGDTQLSAPRWITLKQFDPSSEWAYSGFTGIAGDWLIRSIQVNEHKGYLGIEVHLQRSYTPSITKRGSTRNFKLNPKTWAFSLAKGRTEKLDKVFHAGAVKVGLRHTSATTSDGRDRYYIYNEQSGEWYKSTTKIDRCPSKKGYSATCRVKRSEMKRFQNFQLSSAPVFSTTQKGLAFVNTARIAPHKLQINTAPDNAIIKLVETSDGGRTWGYTEGAPPKPNCINTVPVLNDILLVHCSGSSNEFYQSNDKGVTWTQVKGHGAPL